MEKLWGNSHIPPQVQRKTSMGTRDNLKCLMQPLLIGAVTLVLVTGGAEGARMPKLFCFSGQGLKVHSATWFDDVKCLRYTCYFGNIYTSQCGQPTQPKTLKNCTLIKPSLGRHPLCCHSYHCTNELRTHGRLESEGDEEDWSVEGDDIGPRRMALFPYEP